MDAATDVGSSPLVPVQVTQGGRLGATSSTASAEDFAAVFRHVAARAAELAGRVLDGEVAVRPFRLRRMRKRLRRRRSHQPRSNRPPHHSNRRRSNRPRHSNSNPPPAHRRRPRPGPA